MGEVTVTRQPSCAEGTRQKVRRNMQRQRKLLAIFSLIGLAALPALGQMAGMRNGKMAAKTAHATATTKMTAACCMGGMKMGAMTSGMSAADKKMASCCMAGMKAAGMKPGKAMSGMSAADKKKMGKCCMAGMKPVK